jgi:hypothetical protein
MKWNHDVTRNLPKHPIQESVPFEAICRLNGYLAQDASLSQLIDSQAWRCATGECAPVADEPPDQLKIGHATFTGKPVWETFQTINCF